MSFTPTSGTPWTEDPDNPTDDDFTERLRRVNAKAETNATYLSDEDRDRIDRAVLLDPDTGLIDPDVIPAQEGGELTQDLVNKINQVPAKADQAALDAEAARAIAAEDGLNDDIAAEAARATAAEALKVDELPGSNALAFYSGNDFPEGAPIGTLLIDEDDSTGVFQFGTSAGQVMQGNDSRVVGAADRASMAINVKWSAYGAVGNGIANDTAAIQAALNTGKPVYLPAGDYLISSTLTSSNKNVVLFGDGKGVSRLLMSNFVAGISISGTSGNLVSVELTAFSIGRSNASSYTGTVGPKNILVDYASHVRISNVESYGNIGYSIQTNRSSDIIVTGCHVHDSMTGTTVQSGTDGIHIYQSTNWRVTGCHVHDIGDDAISSGSFNATVPNRNGVVVGNVIHDTAGSIKVYGDSQFLSITSNILRNCLNGGVTLWDDRDVGNSFDIRYVTVSSNTMVGCGGASSSGGVYLAATTGTGTMEFQDILIENNNITGCAYGVTLYSASSTKQFRNCSINGNKIRATTAKGIYIERAIERVRVFGNEVVDSGQEGILVQNTDPTCEIVEENNLVDGFSNGTPGTFYGIWNRPSGLGIKWIVRGNTVTRAAYSATPIKGVIFSSVCHPLSVVNANIVDPITTTGTTNPQSFLADVYAAAAQPTGGTWYAGAYVTNTAPNAGAVQGWTCVTSGTFGTLSGVTGSITSGTKVLVVNDAANLAVGMVIGVAGVTGRMQITSITGTTVTVNNNADATVSGAAVTYAAATFQSFGIVTLSTTSTFDPPSLTTGTETATQTVTLNGATVNSRVDAAFSNDLQGIAIRAWIQGNNTIAYRFANNTGSTIDLASGTVTLWVRK